MQHTHFLSGFSFDFLVFALGGASWSKTGSIGTWLSLFERKGIICKLFEASNSGFEMPDWHKIADSLEGQTIKNCEVKFDNLQKKGDFVISKYGLEGTPIYYMNKAFRSNKNGCLFIDLKPTKTKEEITTILSKSKNITEGLKNLNLSKTAIQFVKLHTSKEEFSSPEQLSEMIKAMKFTPTSLRPIDEVISTIGGISMDAINPDFRLKNFEHIYTCGEMLDWDAPTGGYLIQGCVSSGHFVASTILREFKNLEFQ